MPKSITGLITVALEVAAEGLRLLGEVAKAKKVDEILEGRPSLPETERKAYRRALERLAPKD